MEVFLLIVHILCSIGLVVVILLQSGKGGGLGSGFGGAGAAATQIFGGRGAGNFLSRTTVVLAAVFMSTSLTLAYLSSQPRSLMDLEADGGAGGATEEEIIEEGSGPVTGTPETNVIPVNDPVEEESEPAPVEPPGSSDDAAPSGADGAEAADGEAAEAAEPVEKPAEAVPSPAPAPKPPAVEVKEAESSGSGAAASPVEPKKRMKETNTGAKPEDEALPAPAKTDAPPAAE